MCISLSHLWVYEEYILFSISKLSVTFFVIEIYQSTAFQFSCEMILFLRSGHSHKGKQPYSKLKARAQMCNLNLSIMLHVLYAMSLIG